MEGDGTLTYGTGGNFPDVATSFLQPPERRSSADDEDEKEDGNVSDDPIRVLHPKNLVFEALLRERSDLQPTLASADFENACADIDRKMKALGDDQNRARHPKGQMSDLKMANELESAKFLKKECSDLLRMLASSLDFKGKLYLMHTFILKSLEAEDARPEVGRKMKALGDQKNNIEDLARHFEGQMAKESEADMILKESELMLVVRELYFEAEETWRALMKKKEEVNTLKKMLKESIEEVEAVKKRTNYSVAKHKEAMASLDEKLLVMINKCEELAAKRLKAKLAMEKIEKMIFFFMELIVDMPEKKRIIMTLKKGLMLAKDILKLGNNKLEKELKQLEYHASKLEERAKKILSGREDGGFLQNNRGMVPKKVEKGLIFSRVTAAAIMTSSGIAGAAIAAFCLRHK